MMKEFSNTSNKAIELINRIGEFKKKYDSKDELSILDALFEMADKDGVDVDEYIDILSDSDSFKNILENDLSTRGLLYINGERVKIKKMEEW